MKFAAASASDEATAIAPAVVPGHQSIHDNGVSYVVTPTICEPSRAAAARAMFPPNEWPIRTTLLVSISPTRSSTCSLTVNGPSCGQERA
jgi:hypothetical protein